VWLGDEARHIVHHLKYDGYTALGTEVARLVARHVARPDTGILVPIPLGQRRHRRRGYNQAGVIARALARRWRLPLGESVLTRVRDTKSQTALDPLRRRANVADAFRARPAPRDENRCRFGPAPAVILVDDVLTTGATVVAAAAALDEAGWSPIGAVTFARALPFEHRVSAVGAGSGAGHTRTVTFDPHTHETLR
jgi:ComF family protein